MADEKKVSLRLLIDPKANKVLFAEAGKDFVDFLFNLLSHPVGTLVKRLADKGKVVSLNDVCNNIEALQNTTIGIIKKVSIYQSNKGYHTTFCLNPAETPFGLTEPIRDNRGRTVTKVVPMDLTEPSGNGSAAVGGGCVAYIVMDDLEVKPMSSIISGITLVNDFNVKNVDTLVQKQVQVGLIQGVELLKASFQNKDVLTTVFL